MGVRCRLTIVSLPVSITTGVVTRPKPQAWATTSYLPGGTGITLKTYCSFVLEEDEAHLSLGLHRYRLRIHSR